MNRWLFATKFLAVGLVTISMMLTGCTVAQNPQTETGSNTAEQVIMAQELTVFRSPTCGCCGLWIEHIRAAGFQVRDEITEDMMAIKQQYGVP